MTLDEVYDWVKDNFRVGDNVATVEGNVEHVEVTSNRDALFLTEAAAVKSMFDVMQGFLQDMSGRTFHWRIPPQTGSEPCWQNDITQPTDDGSYGKRLFSIWKARCRFVIVPDRSL